MATGTPTTSGIKTIDGMEVISATDLNLVITSIDDIVGAAPSTLTTTAKTLVGAVNELAPASGSNATGSWIKYQDGTMITWQSVTLTSPTWTAEGAGYKTGTGAITFPQEFNAAPIVTISATIPQGAWMWAGGSPSGVATDSIATCGVFSFTNPTPSTFFVHVVAIGRWK